MACPLLNIINDCERKLGPFKRMWLYILTSVSLPSSAVPIQLVPRLQVGDYLGDEGRVTGGRGQGT